jgi:ketosteroid isomerase-like protein
MSRADIDLLKQWWAEVAGLGVEAALAHWSEHAWADDIAWRPAEGAPDDHGPMHGRDRLVRYYQDWDEMFDDLEFEAEEFIDAGEGQIIVVQHISGRAKASGVPVDMTYAVLYTLRDGRIASGREFLTRQQALDAAAKVDSEGGSASA